jgi:tetratricopeptide (TPR) repeat protein
MIGRSLCSRPEALYNRGIVLHELKRFDGALASYDRVLKLKPDYAQHTIIAATRCVN